MFLFVRQIQKYTFITYKEHSKIFQSLFQGSNSSLHTVYIVSPKTKKCHSKINHFTLLMDKQYSVLDILLASNAFTFCC